MSRDIRPSRNPSAFPSRPVRGGQDNYLEPDAYESKGSLRPGAGRNASPRSYGSRGPADDRGSSPSYGERSRVGNTLSTGSTASTNSSSGSSLMDRMKVRSAATSTRTSFEEDYNDARPAPSRGGGGGSWARKPGAPSNNNRYQEEEEEEEPQPANDPNSAGNTLWGRVVAAAGSLTVNVSKAWENGVHMEDGEETPLGAESRLTKAMKAYYIERARTQADLPPWLFEDHERRPAKAARAWEDEDPRGGGGGGRASERRGNNAPSGGRRNNDYDEPEPAKPASRSAFRDIYDDAATTSQPTSVTRAPTSAYRDDQRDAGDSKATSRLKALRDAKRLQPNPGAPSGPAASSRYEDEYDSRDRSASRGYQQNDNTYDDRGASSGRYRGQETEEYSGYGSGRRPSAVSDGGYGSGYGSSRPSLEGQRRAPPRAAGLPTGPRQR